MHFCGVSEAFGTGVAQVKLPTNRITFRVDSILPGLTRDDQEAAHLESWKRWARVIGITVDKHANPKTDPTQFIIAANLGGPSGVLADQELPFGQGANLRMRVDASERWVIADNPGPNQINLLAVLCHENGHCLGMQHIAAEGDADLMNATYSPRIYMPQEDDISYGVKLYGKPVVIEPPPPGGLPAEIDAVWEGVFMGATYRAKGKAKRVA
jgi:hypothetical protein